MPSRFVRQPDGRLAVFSTGVDDFTAFGLSADEAFCLRLQERVDDCLDSVLRGLRDSRLGHGPPPENLEGDGLHRWREALEDLAVHSDAARRRRRANYYACLSGYEP